MFGKLYTTFVQCILMTHITLTLNVKDREFGINYCFVVIPQHNITTAADTWGCN